MKVDKQYCMSSFLTFRYIADDNLTFKEGITRKIYSPPPKLFPCKSAEDIDKAIYSVLSKKLDKNTGIMLSGGMDSAILATYMPKGSKAYTLECQAEGAKTETSEARAFAERNGLEHNVVTVTWDDYLNYMPILLRHRGMPVHSIEPMIYKAALQAKKDGCNKLVFGESADVTFGGMDGLLAKDWTFDEFVQRYTYLPPPRALKEPINVLEPYKNYQTGSGFDAHGFVSEFFYFEGLCSYLHACDVAKIEFVAPYPNMYMSGPIDLARIRSGESKYLIRELFAKKYPDFQPAVKLPMPRAVTQWLADWEGPKRDEFISGCTNGMTGDQKWLVYCLEWFLNLIDE